MDWLPLLRLATGVNMTAGAHVTMSKTRKNDRNRAARSTTECGQVNVAFNVYICGKLLASCSTKASHADSVSQNPSEANILPDITGGKRKHVNGVEGSGGNDQKRCRRTAGTDLSKTSCSLEFDGISSPQVEVVPHPEQDVAPPRITRGFRIQDADLREHGFTWLCPKCDAIRVRRQVSTRHSELCRGRFRTIFETMGESRLDRAMGRWHGRQILPWHAGTLLVTKRITAPQFNARKDLAVLARRFGADLSSVPEEWLDMEKAAALLQKHGLLLPVAGGKLRDFRPGERIMFWEVYSGSGNATRAFWSLPLATTK